MQVAEDEVVTQELGLPSKVFFKAAPAECTFNVCAMKRQKGNEANDEEPSSASLRLARAELTRPAPFPARRAEDNSPAIYRWGASANRKVPSGTAEGISPDPEGRRRFRFQPSISFAPGGAHARLRMRYPPLKRWAIFDCPCGTKKTANPIPCVHSPTPPIVDMAGGSRISPWEKRTAISGGRA
jgi:hypothetical protein